MLPINERWRRYTFKLAKSILTQRKQTGFIRECHGDLHLRNLVLIVFSLLQNYAGLMSDENELSEVITVDIELPADIDDLINKIKLYFNENKSPY